jgi:hypothetical protein
MLRRSGHLSRMDAPCDVLWINGRFYTYKCGPLEGKNVSSLAKIIGKKIYLIDTLIDHVKDEGIHEFINNFKIWLSEPANISIREHIESTLYTRKLMEGSVRQYKSGPYQGSIVKEPAELIKGVIYVLGMKLSDAPESDLRVFMEQYKKWLIFTASKYITGGFRLLANKS